MGITLKKVIKTHRKYIKYFRVYSNFSKSTFPSGSYKNKALKLISNIKNSNSNSNNESLFE